MPFHLDILKRTGAIVLRASVKDMMCPRVRLAKAKTQELHDRPSTAMRTVCVYRSERVGAKLFRRNFGEMLENLAGRGGYHWMAGNFLKYAADKAKFGKKTVADLPVDQHMLIALCAPRLCFISYGIPARGDPNWVDAHGSFMAAVLAGPAYRLLDKKDLGTPGNYLTDEMPPVNKLIGGELAWRQHSGGHTNIPNFPAFYEWAGRFISSPGLAKKK